jgi:hypothetical protein
MASTPAGLPSSTWGIARILVSSFVASWFETREDALLTMREGRPHPEDPTEKSVDEIKIQGRHCEERSDEAIHSSAGKGWIAWRSLSSGGALRRPVGWQ